MFKDIALLILISLLFVGCANSSNIEESTDSFEETLIPADSEELINFATITPILATPTIEIITVTDNPERTPIVSSTTPPIIVPTATPAPSLIPTLSPTDTDLYEETEDKYIHIVKPGETLSSIAFKYGLNLSELLLENQQITDVNRIQAGDAIEIPLSSQSQLDLPTKVNEKLVNEPDNSPYEVNRIGVSFDGHEIINYTFGHGSNHVIFVGAIHGGYEWNTALLAYKAIDFFSENPSGIPTNTTIHIVPVANPDGLVKVTGSTSRFSSDSVVEPITLGRTNGNDVDLNRNWECNWAQNAKWYYGDISGGGYPFSEPETLALLNMFRQLDDQLQAVVFWHSQANLIIPGGCNMYHEPSHRLAEAYSLSSGYPVDEWTEYLVTGDVTDWLSTVGIPSITVELINHNDLDWEKNLNGILSIIQELPFR